MKKTAKKVAKKTVAKKPRGRQAGTELRGFVFTGDPGGGGDPLYCDACGYLFKLNGKALKVNAEAAARLQNNSHFTEQ